MRSYSMSEEGEDEHNTRPPTSSGAAEEDPAPPSNPISESQAARDRSRCGSGELNTTETRLGLFTPSGVHHTSTTDGQIASLSAAYELEACSFSANVKYLDDTIGDFQGISWEVENFTLTQDETLDQRFKNDRTEASPTCKRYIENGDVLLIYNDIPYVFSQEFLKRVNTSRGQQIHSMPHLNRGEVAEKVFIYSDESELFEQKTIENFRQCLTPAPIQAQENTVQTESANARHARMWAGLQAGETHRVRDDVTRERYFISGRDGSLMEDTGGCFTGNTKIKLSNGTFKKADDIKPTDMLWVPAHDAIASCTTRVTFVIKEASNKTSRQLFQLSGDSQGLITSDHPIYMDGEWKRPKDVLEGVMSQDPVLNFVTESNLPFEADGRTALSYGGSAPNIDCDQNSTSLYYSHRVDGKPWAFCHLLSFLNLPSDSAMIEASASDLTAARSHGIQIASTGKDDMDEYLTRAVYNP